MKTKMKNINIKISTILFNTIKDYHNNDMIVVNSNIRLILSNALDNLDGWYISNGGVPVNTINHVLQVTDDTHRLIKLTAVEQGYNMNDLVASLIYYEVNV